MVGYFKGEVLARSVAWRVVTAEKFDRCVNYTCIKLVQLCYSRKWLNLIINVQYMFTYEQVLNQVYNLSTADRLRLLEALQKMLNEGVEVEGDSEVIPISEINESELAWQDYLAGRDRGISSKELKLKLFGEKID